MEQTTQSLSRFQELKTMMIAFILIIALLKMVFYNETILSTLKISAALFWLFVIPGYCLTLIWKQESSFFERFIISIPVSTALIGTISYYLGKAGINLLAQSWTLTPAIILATSIIRLLKARKKQ